MMGNPNGLAKSKMHLYVMARGMVDQLNRWENNLLAIKLPYVVGHQHPEANNKSKDIKGLYQLGVRPVRMYEIVFPEPELNTVLNLLRPGKSWNPKYDKYLWGVKKALGLMPIPNYILDNKFDAFHTKWIDCTAIGLRKDRYENGIELL